MLMIPVKTIFSKAASGRMVSTDPALARGSYKSICPTQAENQRRSKFQASSCNLTICVKGNAFLESFLDST